MNKYSFMFALICLGTLAGLFTLAGRGSVTAIVTLSVLGTAALMGLGAVLALAVAALMARREQKQFMNNARENLALMQSAQNLLAAQNRQLLQNQPAAPTSTLLIDNAVFEELDQN